MSMPCGLLFRRFSRGFRVFLGASAPLSFCAVAVTMCASACARGGGGDAGRVDLTPPPPQPTMLTMPTTARPSAERAVSSPDAGESAPAAGKPPMSDHAAKCAIDASFPATLPVPEASAAAEIELGAARALLVVSDSGNAGAVAIVHPGGRVVRTKLDLDARASDDLEGAAWRGGHLYVLTSSGAARRFTPDGRGGLRRSHDAYAIGSPPYVCDDLGAMNCGKNYEGLCLRAGVAPSGACVGYAASKTESALYCLRFQGDQLAIDTSRPAWKLPLEPSTLSDCAFGASGGGGGRGGDAGGAGVAEEVLVVTTNVFGGSHVYVVDESTRGLARVTTPALLNLEAAAIAADGALYLGSDDNGYPSHGYRLTCAGWK